MSLPSQNGIFAALIPDGSRRAVSYDTAQYSSSYERSAEVITDILKVCMQDQRVRIFAAWGLSDDNAQKRSSAERTLLNALFSRYLVKLRADVDCNPYANLKVVHMGNEEYLEKKVQQQLRDIAQHTHERTGKIFGLCLGYGSHDEMQRAVQSSHAEPERDWREFLDLPARGRIPYQQVDLIVRTGTPSSRAYTSGFLLPYQGAGTQLRFDKNYLPDFSADRFMLFVDEITNPKQKPRLGA